MEPSHIVRSFDEELGQIESLLLEMGGLVETGIAESVEALTNADAELCEKVIREDKKVDALEMRIDQMAAFGWLYLVPAGLAQMLFNVWMGRL